MNAAPIHICYLMLAHERPDICARIARNILASGGSLVIHLDGKSPDGFQEDFLIHLGGDVDRVYWAHRERVYWGEWSIVQATLNGLQEIEDQGIDPDYVYLLSGSDYPIRPLSQLAEFLQRRPGREYIDLHDAEATQWVIGGPQVERYRYRHWFNWRRHTRLFDLMLKLQQKLKLERKMPEGLHPYIGAQWWVLTWATCRLVLERAHEPAIVNFFRTTWIPDELFFQTMVGSIVNDQEKLDKRHLTHYMFSDYGRPVVFCDGHGEYLARQPFFFARKVSPHADRLRDQLDEVLASGGQALPSDDQVGRDTGEYREFRERQSNEARGRWTWGQPGQSPLGVLEYNRRPYLVICATSASVLDKARAMLCTIETLQCHGQIFSEEQLDFAEGVEEVAGYRRQDMAIRDQDRPAFLYDILHAREDTLVAYLSLEPAHGSLSVEDSEAAGACSPPHWFDPRATVVLVKNQGMSLLPPPGSQTCMTVEVDICNDDAMERLKEVASAIIVESASQAFISNGVSTSSESAHELQD